MRRLLVVVLTLVVGLAVALGSALIFDAAAQAAGPSVAKSSAKVSQRAAKKAKKVKKHKTYLLPRPADHSPRRNDTSAPNAANAGVPAGTALRVHEGDLTITRAGTVIDGLDIHGFVVIKAPRVTIRRSIIRGSDTAPAASRGLLAITSPSARRYLVEDVTLRPQVTSANIDGIKVNQPGTLRRLDLSGSIDGIVVYGNGVRVERSYLHDFTHLQSDPHQNGGPSHDDAIQVQAGTDNRIVANTLGGAYNAAVMVTQDAGRTRNLWINRNWIDGGGCSINYKSNGPYKRGMRANNNLFGPDTRVPGCAIIHNASRSDLVPRGNVWEGTGSIAQARIGS